MVDINDVLRTNTLMVEDHSIRAALAAIDRGARITSMTLSSGIETAPNMPVMVDTRYIDYPEQMVEAIKTALQQRQDAIHDELAGLGVTGIAGR